MRLGLHTGLCQENLWFGVARTRTPPEPTACCSLCGALAPWAPMLPSKRNLLRQQAVFGGTAKLFLGCSAAEQRWVSQSERKSPGVRVQRQPPGAWETGGRALSQPWAPAPGDGLVLLPLQLLGVPGAPCSGCSWFPGASVHINKWGGELGE